VEDTRGFTVPFPLDPELAQELDDERKQQVTRRWGYLKRPSF
jgi:hypothetical protein